MNITRDDLLHSDWNTLFTRDPATFFEAVLINILWDMTPGKIDQRLIDRQKLIFMKWHEYYGANLRFDITAELSAKETPKLSTAYNNGHLAGQIHALRNLPIKRNGLGKVVDLKAVTELLNQLRAQNTK